MTVRGKFTLPKFGGELRFALTEANHVAIHTPSQGHDTPIDVYPEVNGVRYHVGVHLHRQPDGSWSVRHSPTYKSNLDDVTVGISSSLLSLSRVRNDRNPTDAAYSKIHAAVIAHWTEIVSNANRVEAHTEHLIGNRSKCEEAVAEAQTALDEAQKALDAVKVEQRQLGTCGADALPIAFKS